VAENIEWVSLGAGFPNLLYFFFMETSGEEAPCGTRHPKTDPGNGAS